VSAIAIVGAGPGLGLELARRFGSEGFDVALVARNKAKLDDLVGQLAAEQISATAFTADVTDRPELRQAIHTAADRLGGIDVLEYSPADRSSGALLPVDVREATPENVQPQIDYYLYGAMTAAAAVLPAMRDAGAGTLLFTTGGGSTYPVPQFGNVTAAMGALRNWALNLGVAVSPHGIYVAHVAISVWIGDSAPEGMPSLPASDIAARYWELSSNRTEPELVVRGGDA
jgi:NAD(P)-dependent dehydrogenase (short-subunit alcohol dehydrogenase family)